MTISPLQPRPRRRPTRSRPLLYWLVGLALAAVLFGVGVAVGEALHDNPTPGIMRTSVRTLHP